MPTSHRWEDGSVELTMLAGGVLKYFDKTIVLTANNDNYDSTQMGEFKVL